MKTLLEVIKLNKSNIDDIIIPNEIIDSNYLRDIANEYFIKGSYSDHLLHHIFADEKKYPFFKNQNNCFDFKCVIDNTIKYFVDKYASFEINKFIERCIKNLKKVIHAKSFTQDILDKLEKTLYDDFKSVADGTWKLP